MANIVFPVTTGTVCRLLNVAEHRLTNLERLNKLHVPLVCGRRAWNAADVLAAAKMLDRATPEIRNICMAPSSEGRP